MRKIYILSVFIFSLAIYGISAQSVERDLQVSGVVLDESGEPLPGTNIFIKNEPGVGVVSDIDGNFSIITSKNTILVFSFIHFERKEILITESISDLKVILKESEGTELEEVVVVGHGQQRKVSVVGSISTVDVKELRTPPLPSPMH